MEKTHNYFRKLTRPPLIICWSCVTRDGHENLTIFSSWFELYLVKGSFNNHVDIFPVFEHLPKPNHYFKKQPRWTILEATIYNNGQHVYFLAGPFKSWSIQKTARSYSIFLAWAIWLTGHFFYLERGQELGFQESPTQLILATFYLPETSNQL